MGIALYWIEIKSEMLTEFLEDPIFADNITNSSILADNQLDEFDTRPSYKIVSHLWINYGTACYVADLDGPEYGDLVHKYLYGDAKIEKSENALRVFSEAHFNEALTAFKEIDDEFFKYLNGIQDRNNRLLSMDA